MLKKLVSFICAQALILGIAVPSMAKVDESMANTATNNIYVEGVAENTDTVTLALKNTQGVVAYADEAVTDSKGAYEFKFKFNDDVENYTLSVNDKGKDITGTVTLTKTENLGLIGEISASELAEESFSFTADMKNKLDDGGKCKLIYASYDATDKLLGLESTDYVYGFDTTSETFTKQAKEGAAKVKVFMWQSMTNCIPLAKATSALPKKNIVLIGDSLGQTYGEDDCTKGWGQYLANYMNGGANVINCCHAGWRTLSYLAYDDPNASNFWLQGWEYAKTFLNEGDWVVFGLGYNDYSQKGYNGKYYDMVDGVKKMYYTYSSDDIKSAQPTWSYDRQKDENQKEYIEIEGVGKVYTHDSKISDLTTDSDNGVLSYFYLDENGVKQSYAADAFYDNMKEMLDDCREMGVNAVIRNVACINSPYNPQSRENTSYHGFVTHAILNEKIEKLAKEYDNVTAVDLFTETKAHFTQLYDSYSETAPAYAYDDNGELKEYYKNVKNWQQQQLNDTYWLTVKTIGEYYRTGKPELLNGSWVYRKADGTHRIQDTLHMCGAGADYIASAIAKLVKQSDCGLAEYIK